MCKFICIFVKKVLPLLRFFGSIPMKSLALEDEETGLRLRQPGLAMHVPTLTV